MILGQAHINLPQGRFFYIDFYKLVAKRLSWPKKFLSKISTDQAIDKKLNNVYTELRWCYEY